MIETFDDQSPPAGSRPELVIRLLNHLSQIGITWVYLRGYESLPSTVGNDVDLLVPEGMRNHVADLLKKEALKLGWKELYRAHFGPLAQYFWHPDTAETVHFDIFDRLEWKFIPFANEAHILKNRRWNGLVFTPSGEDEIYLNLISRLIYQGVIREQHQTAAHRFDPSGDRITHTFACHLGSRGARLSSSLALGSWKGSARLMKQVRITALIHYALHTPIRLMRSFTRLMGRTILKSYRPPGKLIVLQSGAYGETKRLIESLAPWCSSWCAGRPVYHLSRTPFNLSPEPVLSPPLVSAPLPVNRLSWIAPVVSVVQHVLFIRPKLCSSHVVMEHRQSDTSSSPLLADAEIILREKCYPDHAEPYQHQDEKTPKQRTFIDVAGKNFDEAELSVKRSILSTLFS